MIDYQYKYEQACKIYKCLTCRYFAMSETEDGDIFDVCLLQKSATQQLRIKKRCKNYEQKISKHTKDMEDRTH